MTVARYHIEHLSRYRYQSPAKGCVMSVCLRPRQDNRQKIVSFSLDIQPAAEPGCEIDFLGNHHHVFNIHRRHRQLDIVVRSEIELSVPQPLPELLAADNWQTIDQQKDTFDHWHFTHPSELTNPSPCLQQFIAEQGIAKQNDPLTSILALNDLLYERFTYQPGSTSVSSPIDHILQNRCGVCQDYAHVMLAIVRGWGIPARYVSGYLWANDDGKQQSPTTASHAWIECLLPEIGWVGFDPTNCTVNDDRHLRIAVGRDYRDVAPTRGVLQGGGKTELEVSVRVDRL